MIGVLILLLLLGGLAYLAVKVVAEPSRTEQSVREDLLAADRQLDAEHRRTRQAMNDAAGQSWRNLAG